MAVVLEGLVFGLEVELTELGIGNLLYGVVKNLEYGLQHALGELVVF
jgi:hypothetical protein